MGNITLAIIMAVTSNTQNPLRIGECLIGDYASAGRLKPSVIKSAISSIDKSLILKKLGILSSTVPYFVQK